LNLSKIGDLGTQVMELTPGSTPDESARNEGNKPEPEKAAN